MEAVNITKLSVLENYYRPETIEEALKLKGSHNDSKFLAGGTNVVTQDEKTKSLIDLQDLSLAFIREDEENILIGPMTTITSLQKNPKIEKITNGLIKKACYEFASTQIRNISTIGGNIAQSYPWSILPVVLLALDAKIKINSVNREKIVTSTVFFSNQPRLQPDELITEIIINKKQDPGIFFDYSRVKSDYCLVTCAMKAKTNGKKLDNVIIAVGSIIKKPARLTELEIIIESMEQINENDLVKVLDLELDKIEMTSSIIISKEWRKQYIKVNIRRGLLKLLKEDQK